MTFHCPGHDYPSLRQAMGRWWHHLSSVDSRSPVQIFAEQHQHERGLKSSEFSLLDLTTQCWHADGSNCFKFGEFFVVCPHVCQFGSFPTFRLLQISVEALIRISILHLWKLSCVINHREYLRCFFSYDYRGFKFQTFNILHSIFFPQSPSFSVETPHVSLTDFGWSVSQEKSAEMSFAHWLGAGGDIETFTSGRLSGSVDV